MNQLSTGAMMIAIAPVRKRRLSTQVAESLHSYIIERALQPGDRLPPERDLAAALAVSRNVLREAVRILEDQGLVTVNQGAGTTIRERLPVPEQFQSAELKQGRASDDMALEARAIFEAGLAEIVIKRATEDDIQRLEQIVAGMQRRLSASRPGTKEDLAFHEQLLRCTHNPEVLRLGRTIVLAYLRTYVLHRSVSVQLAAPEIVDLDEHAAIVAAVRQRDIAGLHRLLRFHGYPMDSPERVEAGLLPYWSRLGERDERRDRQP